MVRKDRRLSREILGLLAVCFAIALFLFQILSMSSIAIVDGVLAAQKLMPKDAQRMALDAWVLNLSLLISVLFFIVLFLFLLGERLSYIRDIAKGIDALRAGNMDYKVPVEMNNELTRLAEAVNYLSASQRRIQERERALSAEKEQLIRSLSHDIRTPLTSILAYSAFLSDHEDCTIEKRREQLALIRRKAEQIQGLSESLLESGRRNPERFDDARLLLAQLAAEFEEALEENFRVVVERPELPAFSGVFDVRELRRIFDNLSSNIQKYADPAQAVVLSIYREGQLLFIRQTNAVHPNPQRAESHRMGLNSIRRIACSYAGRVDVEQSAETFEITIVLSEY